MTASPLFKNLFSALDAASTQPALILSTTGQTGGGPGHAASTDGLTTKADSILALDQFLPPPMPSTISDDRLGDVILQSVKNGAYPDDEEAVAAELPSSALRTLSQLLEQARAEVKTSIRELSKITAPDVDGWISQARRLQDDIEDSQRQAGHITACAAEEAQLQTLVRDAGAKVNLLNGEVIFNEALARTLQQINEIRYTLESVQDAVLDYSLLSAVTLLGKVNLQLESLKDCSNTRLAEILRVKSADLRSAVEKALGECWDSLVQINATSSSISFQRETSHQPTINAESTIHALEEVGILQTKISLLRTDIDNIILAPRLRIDADGSMGLLHIEGAKLQISGRSSDTTTQKLLSDIIRVIEFLSINLLPSVVTPLFNILMPNLISKLESGPLLATIPVDLDGISLFNNIITQVSQFAITLDSHGWHGKASLMEWIAQAPQVWIGKRRETALHMVRQLLLDGLGDPRVVERVETQVVSHEEDMFVAPAGNDDWDTKWSEDYNNEKSNTQAVRSNGSPQQTAEEDVSAWGLEDDLVDQKKEPNTSHVNIVEDETDAWGWGDEDDNEESTKHPDSAPHQAFMPKADHNSNSKVPSEREITLRETYNITAFPEKLLEIIVQIFEDVETLTQSSSTQNPIAPAALALLHLPGLILSLFRAIAPNSYARTINGNMFQYNDSLYISEQLRKFIQDKDLHASGKSISNFDKLNLEPDILALELYGKRAYGKEMESQRTILGDLLDGAQGFTNCTESPFAQECDIAIGSVVDRLRNVHQQWKNVLSHSALLQSVGSLLSTIINKIVVDIEDMNDISEPESQRLTSFCQRVILLEDLFLSEGASQTAPPTEGSTIPLTAVYTPGWLKFQYLVNILESSLVDIKYLWSEGELSLEFDAEELVDLIEALFADSEYRRRAIIDIRRSSRGR